MRQANDPNLSTTQVQVIPLPRSGLHCGPLRFGQGPAARRVIPLPRSGLHCGEVVGITAGQFEASSRSQGAGSIAARPLPLGGHHQPFRSSRSQGAGSIAAG